jgi:CubicO group peptidase (beta-lactamase class C family)
MSTFPLCRILPGVLLSLCSGAAFAATPLLTTDPSELARIALGPLAGTAVVGVLQANHASFGAVGEQAKQSEHLLFEIGSISKVFTGLLLAQAVERGELKLDTTLGSLKLTRAPLPSKVAAITLRQLVTHTSCLPNDPNDIADETNRTETLAHYPRTRLWSALASQQMSHEAPCDAEYSNFGFGVLGEALAAHYRTSWEQLVRLRITAPLGMRETIGHVGGKAGKLAVAYGDDKRVKPWLAWGAFAGAGGLYSNARDMLTFSRALLAGRKGPLGAAAERVLEPLSGSEIAYAIEIRGFAKQRTYSKNGRTGGYSSYWSILPDTHEALIVLASNADAHGDGLGREILAQRYPAPQPVADSGGNLPDYAGVYRINEKSTFTFVVQDRQLYGRLIGQKFGRLLPAGSDTFVLPGVDVAFSFSRVHGHVKTVTMRQLGAELVAQRTDRPPPSVARLSTVTQQTYGGYYQGVVLDEKIGYAVQAQDGQLEIRPDKEREQAVFPQEGQADQFTSDATSASYHFERDASGAISSLIVQRNGRSVRTLRAVPPAPPVHEVAIYLRGSMNDWGIQTKLEPTDGGKLSAMVQLAKGSYQFKVASEDWKRVDLGSIGSDANTDDGAPHAVGTAGEKLMLKVAEPSRYRVTLETNNGTTLLLSVNRVP